MKKLFLLLLLHAWATASFAQFSASVPAVDEAYAPPTRWQQHADSIFQHINRSQVSTGLLVNYGFALKDYTQFQGTTLTAANRLQSLAEWRLLYTALQTSVFNANATLPSLLVANQRIEQAQQSTTVVSLATLLARYDRFRDDAGTAGLVTVSNRQLYDAAARPRSPYEQRTLVALCPLQTVLATRTPQFVLPALLRFTNAAPTVTALELDAGDGQGYRPVGWDQPVGASYAANGSYTLRLRLTCADGSVLLSQARLEVQQPDAVAARYSSNAVTQHSSTLFTDTRAYNGIVAGGKVTVAYADGNLTGTIRKPLIVFEGYDVSHALDNPRYNVNYRSFISEDLYGAINTVYDPVAGTNDRNSFRDQLSDVGQYDLIFLDYDNGTDYMQRNAYLAERLIQWVNDNKQPFNGVRQQNVVMGMSMGGLVARYALRDMEVRRASNPSLPAHDTRLYISHEAPHQGANVPLGFQYMVKSVAAISLLPGYTLGKANPELGDAAGLLEEPATKQLLIYQTDPNGTAMHNAWLNEYNQLGYPTQCRNVATSGGSECGRPQSFAPGARLLSIQGNGLLDSDYNSYANTTYFLTALGAGVAAGGPLGLLAGISVGLVFGLGNFEGHVDFTVNALPSQQQQNIFHGRFSICKDILFGAFSTCLLNYADDNNSETYMLPYDSAPGGIYDLNQVSGGALNNIGPSIPVAGVFAKVLPTFCFVPTTSALDIGNNQVALAPQDLTASYTNAAPPAAPRNTPFANFITGVRQNLTHILWNGLNSKWAFREMEQVPQNVSCQAFCQAEPTISGPGAICDAGATFGISGLPPGTQVFWSLSTSATVTSYGATGLTFTTAYTGASTSYGGSGTLTATLYSECGTLPLQKPLFAGPPDLPIISGPEEVYECSAGGPTFFIDNYNPALSYTFTTSSQIQLRPFRSGTIYSLTRRAGAGYITVTATNDCGSSLSTQFDFTVLPCTAYTAYPNPADDNLTVEQTDSTSSTSTQRSTAARGASATASSSAALSTPYTVRLFDSYGVQQVQQATTSPTVQLATGSLPTGLYLLHIEVGGVVVERRRLQITH